MITRPPDVRMGIQMTQLTVCSSTKYKFTFSNVIYIYEIASWMFHCFPPQSYLVLNFQFNSRYYCIIQKTNGVWLVIGHFGIFAVCLGEVWRITSKYDCKWVDPFLHYTCVPPSCGRTAKYVVPRKHSCLWIVLTNLDHRIDVISS
jgi:hypothetical protein